MAKVLYIKASPRGERSYSVAVAESFIESYKATHPGDEIVTVNVFEKKLPPFDGLALQAKYTILNGKNHTLDEQSAWQAVEDLIKEFKAADKYVFAVPMWNFNIPYRLKHYIDIIVQPTYTFSYSPDAGYKGLVTGRPVFISYSRGGEYAAGTPAEAADFQTKYLEFILGFIGLTDIRKVVTEPTLAGGPEVAKDKREKAKALARDMAKKF